LLLSLAVLLAACATPAPPAPTPPPAEDLSIQLSWVHEYSSAGFYAAERGGHFAAAGLRVRLEEGGFGESGYIEPIDAVLSGEVDFGLAGAGSIIEARAAGKPVVAISALLQRSPTAVIIRADSDIARPQDLEGRSVAVAGGGASTMLAALLQAQKVDAGAVRQVERTSFGVAPLLNGEVDALVGWVINEGVELREAGLEPRFLLVSDYGVDTYDLVLFTSEQMIAERPELVQRLVDAVMRGLADVIADPERAIEHTLAYNPALDRVGQLDRLRASIPLMNPPGSRLGDMQADIWGLTQDMLLQQRALRQPTDLRTAFTREFIERSYEGE
jgi:NitT/TauT family transport system substrate-binding protein